jgi:putative addiction module killer protein
LKDCIQKDTIKVESTSVFDEWLDTLRDVRARARIRARVERLSVGNPGQHRVLSGGVCEMKVDYGPGYRVYYTLRGTVLLILLCGGDKSTQASDIRLATRLARGL